MHSNEAATCGSSFKILHNPFHYWASRLSLLSYMLYIYWPAAWSSSHNIDWLIILFMEVSIEMGNLLAWSKSQAAAQQMGSGSILLILLLSLCSNWNNDEHISRCFKLHGPPIFWRALAYICSAAKIVTDNGFCVKCIPPSKRMAKTTAIRTNIAFIRMKSVLTRGKRVSRMWCAYFDTAILFFLSVY